MKKLLIGLLSIYSITTLANTTLLCHDKEIDMEMVHNRNVSYLNQLYDHNCGVEGETCFQGQDFKAYQLIAELNNALYEESDEVSIIGAYYTTDDRNTIVLKYLEEGEYNETLIYKCK